MKHALQITSVIAAFLAAITVGIYFSEAKSTSALATSLCDVTAVKVAVGNQAVTQLLVAGSYQWVSVEQPINATNTVSIGMGFTPKADTGFLLTPATSTSPVPYMRVGFAPDIPYRGALSAITNVGSTTVVVLSCK